MNTSTYFLSSNRKQSSYGPAQRAALRTAIAARESAELLERVFRLVTEDDAIQPAIKHVYAALCEAETRAAVIEDWYRRTYPENRWAERPRQATPQSARLKTRTAVCL
ncbi:hypothetical protein BH23ACT11_BH23ACT11_17590 [soil metagenome]